MSLQDVIALNATARLNCLAGFNVTAAENGAAEIVLDWNGDLRFPLSLAGTRASMKTEPTSEQVKSLLASASAKRSSKVATVPGCNE